MPCAAVLHSKTVHESRSKHEKPGSFGSCSCETSFFVHPSSMQVMGLNWASLSGRLSLALSRGLVLVEVWDSADVGSGPTGQLLAIDLHPKAWGPLRVLLMFPVVSFPIYCLVGKSGQIRIIRSDYSPFLCMVGWGGEVLQFFRRMYKVFGWRVRKCG